MNKSMGIVMLIAGIILLIYGFNAADSISSSFSKLFSGAPTDRSIALLIGGFALTGFGLFSVVQKN